MIWKSASPDRRRFAEDLSVRFLGHLIAQDTQLLDFYFHNISGLQEDRRFSERANACGRSGGDNVAGLQGDACGNIFDEFWNSEDQVAGIRALHHFAVYSSPDGQRMRIPHLVQRRKIGANRAKRVTRFSAHPLLVRELPTPRGYVIQGHIPANIFERLLRRNALTSTSDDHGQLRLKIHIGVRRRKHDVIAGSADAGRKFRENQWRLGQFGEARFHKMVPVIQAHGDNLPWPRYGGSQLNFTKRERVLLDLRFDKTLRQAHGGIACFQEIIHSLKILLRQSRSLGRRAKIEDAIWRQHSESHLSELIFESHQPHLAVSLAAPLFRSASASCKPRPFFAILFYLTRCLADRMPRSSWNDSVAPDFPRD